MPLMLSLLFMVILTSVPASAFASVPDDGQLNAFVEQFMEREMKDEHVPGAVVSIVQDGKPVLMKGYGYADLERQAPADPYKTVFRTGSLAKLFTSTAVMQQVEAGRLDLHADIKRYLPDLKLKYIDDKPITLHHLLTHTAGFYESFYVLGRDKSKQLPLAEAIKRGLPGLVREPGKQVAYSNHGFALAGYIVEQVTGRPYEQVVEDDIFKPLRMTKSGFRFREDDPDLARSYAYSKEKYHPLPYAYIHLLPSGALNATADDMSRFMIAHLQRGRFENVRLMSDQSADRMHATQFSADPRMPGIAYDFFERRQNGLRLIEHDGGIDGFVSNLFLIPSEQTGIFIATNSGGGGALTEKFIGAYLDRFYPETQDGAAVAARTPVKELRKMDGYYMINRMQLRGPINFAQNLSASKLKAEEDGVVLFEGERYAETEPFIFRKENGHDLLYLDAKNDLLVTNSVPAMYYERKSAWYHPNFHIVFLLALAAVYPLHIAISAVKGVIGLLRRKKAGIDGVAAVVSVLFVVYFLFAVSMTDLLANEIPYWSYPLLYLPVILLVVLLVRTGFSIAKQRKEGMLRIGYLAATALIVSYMNIWGFFSV